MVFAPGRPFQSSLIFVFKVRSLPQSKAHEISFTRVGQSNQCLRVIPVGYLRRVEHLKGASLVQSLPLLENIRLCQKGLPGANILAYRDHSKVYLYPSLIFACKARSLPLVRSPLKRLLRWHQKVLQYSDPFSQLTNGPNKLECYITLGWRSLPRINTLAYWAIL